MVRTPLLPLLALMTLLAGASAAEPDLTDFDQFQVRIKGVLQQSKQPPSQQQAEIRYTIRSRGLLVELDISRVHEPQSMASLVNQLVELKGSLKRTGPNQILCEVEGDIRRVTVSQYFVGYELAKVEEVKRTSAKLGLRIQDDYRTGKYLVVIPTAKFQTSALESLRNADGVRFVEINQTVSISPEDLKPVSQQP